VQALAPWFYRLRRGSTACTVVQNNNATPQAAALRLRTTLRHLRTTLRRN